MISKPIPVAIQPRPYGILNVLRNELRQWLRALTPGQDGPNGRLPEDLDARGQLA